MSYQVQTLKESILTSLERSEEFLCLSIDATLKVCVTMQGQASYRASAEVRNAACFDDSQSLRRVLTIRGRTGAVLGIVPVPREEPPKVRECLSQLLSNLALCQIRFIAAYNPSQKLFNERRKICPNLDCLSLDPVHLAIVYEYAQWGKRTSGSKVLRRLMNKMNQIAPNMRPSSWGDFYIGSAPPSLNREEERVRQLIADAGMGATRAKRTLEKLEPESPYSVGSPSPHTPMRSPCQQRG